MLHRPFIRHLVITINNVDYVFGSLSIKPHRNEMTYLFHFPKDFLNESLNINRNQKTPRLDHITWHQNRSHIKLFDKTTSVSVRYEPFLPSQKTIKPIYVESLYPDAMESYPMIPSSQFKSFKEGEKIRILALNSPINFSVFFGLLPSDWQFDGVYVAPAESPTLLFSLRQLHFGILRIQKALGFWDLLICVSPYVPGGKFEHSMMTGPQRRFDHMSPGSSIDLMIKNIFISMLVRICNAIIQLKTGAMS